MSAKIVEFTTILKARNVATIAVPDADYTADNEGMKKDSPYAYTHKEPPGSTIHALRNAKGWSQRDLAERAGLDHTRISGIERGIGGYTSDALTKIATALGVSVPDLFLPPELARLNRLPREVRDRIKAYIDVEEVLAAKASQQHAS